MALLMGGCASGDRSEAPATAPSPAATAPSTAPVATSAQPAPGKPATQQQGFSRPVVPPTPVKSTIAVPGLVQPTNATARLPQIPSGRRDPFAAVVTTPVVVPAPYNATAKVQPVPKLAPVPKPAAPAAPAQPAVITQPTVTAVALPPAMPPAALPQLQPSSAPLSTLPLPPAPAAPMSLASAVTVTGVVQVGETVSAIVKVPNEGSDRYVRAGEYLGNGQVLVKRIEANREEPIVVLEQNGVEVIKAVGEAGNTVARAF
jgi:hypothetical protein